MQDFIYYSPTKIYFGPSYLDQIGKIINEYGYKNILLVYGSTSAIKSGLLSKLENLISAEGIKVTLLGKVKPNPSLKKVEEGLAIAKDKNIDFILAVGGGSVIDTAKAIACGFYYDGPVWDFSIHKVTPKNALKIGTVLTHSAAGSELSNSCVITNEDLKIKSGFNSDIIRPLFSFLNPVLTYTLTPYQTACGIVDMIMHTLERFLTDVDNLYFEEEIALGLIKSVMKSAAILKNNSTDYNARANLMIASSFSHNGLTGVGGKFYFTVHKLEHELSGLYDNISHGEGLAVLFPAWAMTVYQYLPHKFAVFARSVFNVCEQDDLKASKLGIEKIQNYFTSLGMHQRLRDLGVKIDDLVFMANRLTENNQTSVNGFVKLDFEKVLTIFKLAY